MSDVVAAVCLCVPDDGQWCEMYRAELLCGKEAKDIPDKLVDDVLRKVDVQRAKILQLVPYMHRECIITNDEHQQLTNPQTTDLMRGNLLSRILMGKQIHWLLKFCHCLLQSYESERGLDIHYTLLQQIKGDLHYHLKEDPLQQDQGIYAENVATNVKSVPITHDAKERLIRRLNIESHRNLLEYLNQVTTSDVAKAWLSANVTRDWTVLVEALFTEPGLGCSVSGVLPLSSSNPPAVWNYVRDMGKDWEHLARFLGYSDSLISEIQTKRSWDVKSQIHSFMRVCLIPDCGERRTEEILEKINIFLGHPSQSDHKSVQPPESKGAAKFRHAMFDNSASPYKEDYQPVYHTDTKGHHELAKETGDSWGRKFHQDRASPQASPQASLQASPQPSPQLFRMDSASTEIKKTSDGRSEEQILAIKCSNNRTIPEDSTQETQHIQYQDDGQELLQACTSEQWDVAEALVNSGGMLEGQDKDGRTPLHICCIKGKMKMVKLLIEYGSNITAKDKLDNCCLHHKETLKNHDVASLVIKAFVKKDTSIDQPNKNDMTPLMVACQSGEICSQAALILITHGARVDGLPNVKDKPLICASARGNAKMVDYLLTYCADINQKDGRDGSTALIQACLCNHPGIVKVLLEREANVNLADKDGTTALAAAVSKNAYEMVQMLIEKAADVNCTRHRDGMIGSHEETPLASACARGYRDVAELLIHNGANVNFLCSDAVPPIGFAILCRQHHMVRFLLEVEGYDKSIYGLRIPLDIAVRSEKYAAAKILLDARGGPEVALQEAQQNHLFELADRIQIVQSLPEADLSLSAFEEPAVRRAGSFQMRDQAVKVEEVLQTFSQICMAAITSNKDCEQFLEILKALKAPSHISSFIQGFYRGTQRPDILKATFLSSDTGISPASFFISHQFVDAAQFHIHAMEFFPDGPGKFYEELVWTFHQISGGEDLPYDVNRVLDQMFGGHFSLNVHTTTIGSHVPIQHQTWPETQPETQPEPQPYANLQSHKDSHHRRIPNEGGVSASIAKPELTEAAVLQSPSLDMEEVNKDSGDHKELHTPVNVLRCPGTLQLSVSTMELPANQGDNLSDPETPEDERRNVFGEIYMKQTAKQSDTTSDPETPEEERKNDFGEAKSQRKPHLKVHKGTTRRPINKRTDVHKGTTTQPTINRRTDVHKGTTRQPTINRRTDVHKGTTTQPTINRRTDVHKGTTRQPTINKRTGRHSPHLRLEVPAVKFLGKRIGVGAFGIVEAVEIKGKICAAKYFRDNSNFNTKTFFREFQIMQALKHDHIVVYYGYYMPKQGETPTRSPVLIMECLKTNLSDFLVSESNQNLPLDRKVELLYGIAQGLNYLHSMSVIHRDLTATNVLLDSKAVPKISDFGNSCVTGIDLGSELHTQSLTQCPGTLNYMAPEAQSSRNYGTEIDIFSYGHLSLFVGVQQSPNLLLPPNYLGDESDDDDDLIHARNEVQRRQKYFTLLYQKLEEMHPLVLLMKKCLSNSPKRRPKAHELVLQLDKMHKQLPLPSPVFEMKQHASALQFEGIYSQHLKSEIKDVIFVERRIGEGAFGYVEEVEVKGKTFAAKEFKVDRNLNMKTFFEGFQIMQALKHDHIVDYYGYHIQEVSKALVLIMECFATNLHDFLLSESHQNLPLERKVELLYGIAQGLNYLHNEHVIHRDLTATNVLLDCKAVPRISDFGNSCVTGIFLGLQSLAQFPCRLNYMAPETLWNPKYGTEVDIFSFGHLSLFVGIQQSPNDLLPHSYPEEDDDGLVSRRNEVDRRQKYFTLLYKKLEENHPLVQIIKICLHNRPERRPKTCELVSQLETIRKELPLPPPLTVKNKHGNTPTRMQERKSSEKVSEERVTQKTNNDDKPGAVSSDTSPEHVKMHVKSLEVENEKLRRQLDHRKLRSSYNNFLGVEVVSEEELVVTNEVMTFRWKDHGFKLHVPENALPSGIPEYLVNIKASLAGQFELPEGYELVSAVYWVATPGAFTKPVTIEVQHCANFSKPSQLRFVRTSCAQKSLPYKFKFVDGGLFIPGNKYGVLSTTHFSGSGIAKEVTSGEHSCQYCAQVYFTVQHLPDYWYCHFVITKDLEMCLAVVKRKYQQEYDIAPEITFGGDHIALDIPDDGAKTDNGWEIVPVHKAHIKKDRVDKFSSQNTWVPECVLLLKWLQKDKPPCPLEYKIKLKGTGDENDFFRIFRHPGSGSGMLSSLAHHPQQQTSDLQGSGSEMHLTNGNATQATSTSGLIHQPQQKTSDEELSGHHMAEISAYLSGMESAKILNLGLFLGLDYIKLKNNMNSETFLLDTIYAWLQKEDGAANKGNPTWQTLVNALKSKGVGQAGIAAEIAKDKNLSL